MTQRIEPPVEPGFQPQPQPADPGLFMPVNFDVTPPPAPPATEDVAPSPGPAPEDVAPSPVLEETPTPPEETPPADPDAPKDVTEFTPIEFGAEPPEPSEPETPAEPERPDNIKLMRGEISRQKEEIATLKSQIEEKATSSNQGAEQVQKLEAELTALRNQLAIEKPDIHPDVKALTAPAEDRIRTMARQIAHSDPDNGKELGQKFAANAEALVENLIKAGDPLDPDTDTSAVTKFVYEEFGEENAFRIMEVLSQSASAVEQARKKMQEISESGANDSLQRATQEYRQITAAYEENIASQFEPEPGLKEKDPLHPLVILQELGSQSESVSKAIADSKQLAKLVHLPLPPVTPQEIEGKTPQEVEKALKARETRRNEAIQSSQRIFPAAIMSYRVLPEVFKSLQSALKQLEEYRKAGPPAPSGTATHPVGGEEAEGPKDVTQFTPKPYPGD